MDDIVKSIKTVWLPFLHVREVLLLLLFNSTIKRELSCIKTEMLAIIRQTIITTMKNENKTQL